MIDEEKKVLGMEVTFSDDSSFYVIQEDIESLSMNGLSQNYMLEDNKQETWYECKELSFTLLPSCVLVNTLLAVYGKAVLWIVIEYSDGETVLIAGKVLGSGLLSKAVTVAAYNFSVTALEKIEEVGGKCLTIEQILEENPKGSGIRILQ